MVCEEIWKGIMTSLSDYLDLSGVYLKIKKNCVDLETLFPPRCPYTTQPRRSCNQRGVQG